MAEVEKLHRQETVRNAACRRTVRKGFAFPTLLN
jgi:hypothetical protein